MGGCPPVEDPPGSTVSDEQRKASLDEVQAAVDSIGFDGDPAKTQQIADAMKAMSHFQSVDVGDGVIFAKFTDGEILVVMNNRPNNYPEQDDSRIKKPDPAAMHLPPAGDSAKSNLPPRSVDEKKVAVPASNKAILINAMGTSYCDLTPTIGAWLSGANYSVTKLSGSVEELRDKVKDAGVLYYSGHGSVFPPGMLPETLPKPLADRTEHFGLWTSTRCTLENFPTYRQKVKEGYLSYGICPTDRTAGNMEDCEDRNGIMVSDESHYVITDYFINEYWRCSEGSLVYLDACHGSQVDSVMPDLCIRTDVNASAVVGWTAGVLDQWSTPSAYYFFDRLLGVNAYRPTSPAQRPYSVNNVLARMKLVSRMNLSLPLSQSKSYKGVYLVDTDEPAYIADLVVDYADDTQDLLLRPAIKGLVVYEGSNKRIVVEGDFGSEPGTVTLNGSELPFSGDGWTRSRIQCALPDDGSGRVLVTTADRESNPRHLTKWDLSFHQLFMDYATQTSTDCPNCFYDATMNFTIRGDIGGVRLEIDGDVARPGFTGSPSDGDLEVTNAGGTYTYAAGGTITLSPNPDHGAAFIGTCVGFLPPEDNNYFGACFFFDGPNDVVRFSPTTLAEALFGSYNGGPYDGTITPFGILYSGNILDKTLNLSLTPNFTIEAGQQSTGDNSYFEWEAADPVHPTPDDDPR